MGKTKGKNQSGVSQRVSFELQGVKVTGLVIAEKTTTKCTVQTDGPLKAIITLPKKSLKYES